MADLILFDDGGGRLSPITDLRAAFELRTGAMTTAERLAQQVGSAPVAYAARPEVADLVASRYDVPVNALPDGTSDDFVLVNGRCGRIDFDPPDEPDTALVMYDGSVLAARMTRATAEVFVASNARELPDAVRSIDASAGQLITRPWHVLEQANANLEHDLDILAQRLKPLYTEPAPRVTIVGREPVLVGADTIVHPHVVFDTTAGPICIDDGAEIRSMGVIVGPGYIGKHAAITNHAHIRGHCIIGPVCKVGGEVNATVFQGYSNKGHAGYVGNSYIGEWVNFGADTITSNLKNTYGEIRMQLSPDEAPEPTGTQFLGSIVGDHVKTAIGTRLTTGSCVNTGAMIAVAGLTPKCVERFAFMTDAATMRYDLDKFCDVADQMMSRRDLSVTPALRARLEQLHNGAS